MSGLISTAKEKIWSIVSELSQTQPAPTIKLGMVFYRDRGDAYITKVIPMTLDIDSVYTELLAFRQVVVGIAQKVLTKRYTKRLLK